MHPDRDAATVVETRTRTAVRVQGDLDGVASTGQGLVDAVVHDLDDEVVETTEVRGSDVHPGAAANRLEALEDLDLVGRVRGVANPSSAYWTRIGIAISVASLWARLRL